MSQILLDVDLFPDLRFCAREIKPTVKPTEVFLHAEDFLDKLRETNRNLIENIDNLLMFNDMDAISDVIDDYECELNNFDKEVNYCKQNPFDILYGFEPSGSKSKFRRYANNKRTYQRLGKVEIR